MPKFCILGDVLIDYSILPPPLEDKMRLGGIFHAARGAWAMNMEFELAYFAPSYLDEQISKFVLKQNGTVQKIGNIVGSPNVILIKEAKEIGNQGYELLLRDERKYEIDFSLLKEKINNNYFSEILIFTGGCDLKDLLVFFKSTNIKLHIDISNDIQELFILEALARKFQTIFLSTSSNIFLNYFNGDVNELVKQAAKYCNCLILKENRGGSRYFNFETEVSGQVASQTKKILHSVGVGDNYNLAFLNKINTNDLDDSLNYASWFAMEYASTTFPDDFKLSVERLNNFDIKSLKNLGGVILNWEKRKAIKIYIAAPDFDYVDKNYINLLKASLEYHNFSPRLPIRENGQLTNNSTESEKQQTCDKDIKLLNECNILVAVLLFNDPGTLIEIGLAINSNIPTIVYDPLKIASNCILTQLPLLVSSDLDEIISQIFISASTVNQ